MQTEWLELYLQEANSERYLRRINLEANDTKEEIFRKLRSIKFEIVKDEWPKKLLLKYKRGN